METTQLLPVETLRKDFVILGKKIKDKPLVYLDNGATSLTPEVVVEAIGEYYREYNANVHRGVHTLGEQATYKYELAHTKVAKFINANPDEVIFTKGTTESLNFLAYSLTKQLQKGDEIVLTEMEHHSNIVPWQALAEEKELVVRYIKITSEGNLDMEHAQTIITEKTKIVSTTHVSNVLGCVIPVKELGKLAHKHNALFIVDAAQSVPHMKVDVQAIDCDFLCFSGHKMFGPTGIGVLYGKKEHFTTLNPFLYGGSMIGSVTFAGSTWADAPERYEAGTPNIAGAVGMAKAVEYLERIGIDNIQHYEEELVAYTLAQFKTLKGVTLFGPQTNDRGSVFSFAIDGVHSHDVSSILDREGVAIRGGHMCAMPLVKEVLRVPDVCRASLAFYNTKEDVDTMIKAIQKTQEMFCT